MQTNLSSISEIFDIENKQMGSNFGDQNLGNETLLESSLFRRGKKRNSDNTKKPQRGLGVAQLEKIRLHQMGSTYIPSLHPYVQNCSQEDMRLQTNYLSSSSCFSYSSSLSSPSYGFGTPHGIMMGWPDVERENIKYEESQPINATSFGTVYKQIEKNGWKEQQFGEIDE